MNTATISLPQKAQAVLSVIARGAHTRDAIATKMGVTVPVVNGSITALKRNGLVEVSDEGEIAVTPDASAYVTISGTGSRGPRPGSKMAQARSLFTKFADKGRPAVLEQFRGIGLTEKGASTYYQTLRTEAVQAQAAKSKSRSK